MKTTKTGERSHVRATKGEGTKKKQQIKRKEGFPTTKKGGEAKKHYASKHKKGCRGEPTSREEDVVEGVFGRKEKTSQSQNDLKTGQPVEKSKIGGHKEKKKKAKEGD